MSIRPKHKQTKAEEPRHCCAILDVHSDCILIRTAGSDSSTHFRRHSDFKLRAPIWVRSGDRVTADDMIQDSPYYLIGRIHARTHIFRHTNISMSLVSSTDA